ncbi:MAG: radical SAM protein [Lachnospiraceae bacterium]|nr:radical SAM protein [Lachnospiraceae bacterium]
MYNETISKASAPAEAFPGQPAYICRLCPRKCGAERNETAGEGFCRSPYPLQLIRAAAHFGEEPCISGTKGSGTIFFTGCHLACVYCQNHQISGRKIPGYPVGDDQLVRIIDQLLEQGVHNISFVSASHFSHQIAGVLNRISLPVPVVWNCSGYEDTEALKELEGLVQIYLPDFKYALEELGRKLSFAPHYPETALAAVKEMLRQTGPYRLGEDGLLKSGVLIRHLILPGYIENSLRVIDLLEDELPKGAFLFSLLGQYTPVKALCEAGRLDVFPSLKRPLLPAEFDRVWDYLAFSSLEDGYVQDPDAAGEDAIPAFDGTGILRL